MSAPMSPPVDVWCEEEPLLVAVDRVHVIVQAPVVVEAPEAGGLGTVSTVHHSTVQYSVQYLGVGRRALAGDVDRGAHGLGAVEAAGCGPGGGAGEGAVRVVWGGEDNIECI